MAASSCSGTTASKFSQFLLVDQLYAKEVHLWQHSIKHASNIHRYVFNSFYRIVIHGESHGIIYKEIPLSVVTPFFGIWLPTKIPPNRYMPFHFNGPPSLKTRPRDTWTQSLITSFLNFNLPQYESNHHHKQDLLVTTSKIFDCMLQLQIIKS